MSKAESISQRLAVSGIFGPQDLSLYAQTLSRILINEIFPKLAAEDTNVDDIEEYHYGLTSVISDLSLLLCEGLIEYRHVKQTVKDCWNQYVGYDLMQYASAVQLFDEADGDALEAAIQQVISDPNNAKAIEQIKAGKDKAVGALVGQVMKLVKTDPKSLRETILSKI
ncbi:hypothetical protein RsoM2USA_156 [Ralstonia phage RsoM2USA]|nr:hypothetical protein RsoM2USA_156 [Ralstonia phage RsoM2USA]